MKHGFVYVCGMYMVEISNNSQSDESFYCFPSKFIFSSTFRLSLVFQFGLVKIFCLQVACLHANFSNYFFESQFINF